MNTREFKAGDEIIDTWTGKTYQVVGIGNFKPNGLGLQIQSYFFRDAVGCFSAMPVEDFKHRMRLHNWGPANT